MSALTSVSGPSLPGRSRGLALPGPSSRQDGAEGHPSPFSASHTACVLHSLGSPPEKGVVLEGTGPTVKPPGPDPCPFASQPM